MNGGAVVECVGVVHVYRAAGTDTAALRGLDLHAAAGQQVALLGPSGSGKSTLMSLLAGIRQPSAGAIRIDDRDIARLPDAELRRYRAETVGTLLQGAGDNLLPFASAEENVHFARRARRRSRRTGASAVAVGDFLDAVGVEGHSRRIPVRHLSPSQRQAAAMAVAMSNSPRLLVADEPTSQLDPVSRDALLDALLAVVERIGTTVVVVTHDAAVAMRMQRTVHLRDGRVGEEERNQERLAVLGADRSVQLPDSVAGHWPAGTHVRITAVGPDELRVTRADETASDDAGVDE
jgi:putative ABC transport system ATP-binding protein